MTGIFRKDLLQIRGSWIILLMVILVVCGLLIYFDAPNGMMAFFPVFLAMQATSTIFADRTCGWYRMATTFPITRRRLVLSKYQITAALGITGMLIGLLLWWIVAMIDGNPIDFSLEDTWINFYLGMILVFATTGVLIPLGYLLKRGQEFIATFIAYILPAVMIFYWTQSINSEVMMRNGDVIGMNIDLQMPLLMGMAVFSVLLFVASALIMPGIIARQDQR